MDLIWLIPLLPGIGAAVNGLVGIRYFSRQTSAVVACATMAGALGLSLYAFWQLLGLDPASRVHDVVVGPWIPRLPLQLADGSMGAFEVPWGFRLDPLAAMMALVVTGIGFLIHLYSTAYMHAEPRGGYARFFSYLNLFCFFMLMLVLGSNFLVMFVGWEGVGLCSYLLIGYWYEKKSAADAGKKAFITNRIGDWGFILGIFLVFVTFGSLDFRVVAERAAAWPVETAAFGTVSLICLFLFIGAVGKSAQIPLYVWLPDAMEGPTPVSALIHAATMVTAGVYMVGRNAALFSHAPMVMEIVTIVGVLTAVMAASIGLVQNDIKRVLAYSTVSQLGYMFTAMGLGAFAAGAFHLMTHAFFKALLFLGSGSVIHAMAGEQDMQRMGGLRKYLPVTYMTMFVGTLAIAGIPPLSGFFSKDEILLNAFLGNKAVWGIAVATALMTAFYMFRLMSLTFFGAYRGPAWAHAGHAAVGASGQHLVDTHGAAHAADSGSRMADRVAGGVHDADRGSRIADGGHGRVQDADGGSRMADRGEWHGPHESPGAMTWPLMVLAVGSIVAGFVGVPAALAGSNAIATFLAPSFEGAAHEPHHISHAAEYALMALSAGVAALGIVLAYRFYVQEPSIPERLARGWAGAHRVLFNKYYVDEAYNATIVEGTVAAARGLWTIDRTVVDGAVNGTGKVTVVTSWMSGLTDRSVVDGLVNAVARMIEEASFTFRRLQTGLVQNYALLMLVGVFAFVTGYLFLR
ncbi:MAG: NADH-quinone oxidoreductase subunit L [Vicinamibacterales bacterium]